MSRHEIDNQQTSRVSAFGREVPLPSYDEAVAGGDRELGLKSEDLPPQNSNFRSSRTDRRQRTSNRSDVDERHQRTGNKSIRKKLVIVILTSIIFPTCVMTIFIQRNACSMYTSKEQKELNRMRILYEECSDGMHSLQKRYNNLEEKYSRNQYVVNGLNKMIKNLEDENQKLRSTKLNSIPASQKSGEVMSSTEKLVEEKKNDQDIYMDVLFQCMPFIPFHDISRTIDSLPRNKQLEFLSRLERVKM